MWQLEGGGQTTVLRPVAHNLTHVCPPLKGLHVSSAAHHEMHARDQPKRAPFFLVILLNLKRLRWVYFYFLLLRSRVTKTLSIWPSVVAERCFRCLCPGSPRPHHPSVSRSLLLSLSPSTPPPPTSSSSSPPPQSICIMSICQTASVCSN